LLDKVRFVMKTDIPEDIEYIETLVNENEVYDIAVTDSVDKGFSQLWTSVEKGKYYVKIDDDVVCAVEASALTVADQRRHSSRMERSRR
jgi:hypothetical protein